MPRARTILQSDLPYQITGRCINREWFTIPMSDVWSIFADELTKTVVNYNLQVHSFVLMSNHFHLIASTPDANISQCMWYFMQRSSRRLSRAGNRMNECFAGRHYKCVLGSNSHFLNAYKYNYRNPVHANICKDIEDYEFSTLKGLLVPSKRVIPLVEDTTFESDPEGTLKWLNSSPDPLKLEAVRKALKRPRFKIHKCTKTKLPILNADETI